MRTWYFKKVLFWTNKQAADQNKLYYLTNAVNNKKASRDPKVLHVFKLFISWGELPRRVVLVPAQPPV